MIIKFTTSGINEWLVVENDDDDDGQRDNDHCAYDNNVMATSMCRHCTKIE